MYITEINVSHKYQRFAWRPGVCSSFTHSSYSFGTTNLHRTKLLSGRVGCAYYDPIKCSLYVLEDTQETVHFDLTKMC